MIDGKPYKTLRRHLSTTGMTPAECRECSRLKADYLMVAATYLEAPRAMAKRIGLGRKPGQTNAPKSYTKSAPAPRNRKAKESVAE